MKKSERVLKLGRHSFVGAVVIVEALSPEFIHRMVEMLPDVDETVGFIGVAHLLVEDVMVGELTSQGHRILIVNVVVSSSVYQHELLATQFLHTWQEAGLFVALQVVFWSREAHKTLCVD